MLRVKVHQDFHGEDYRSIPAPPHRCRRVLAVGILLIETIRACGLNTELTGALDQWATPMTTHLPGKILCDLALSLALGGDCLADLAKVRAEPGLFGPVVSDPTVSRLTFLLGDDPDRAEKAISQTRKTARRRVWALARAPHPTSNQCGRPVDHRR